MKNTFIHLSWRVWAFVVSPCLTSFSLSSAQAGGQPLTRRNATWNSSRPTCSSHLKTQAAYQFLCRWLRVLPRDEWNHLLCCSTLAISAPSTASKWCRKEHKKMQVKKQSQQIQSRRWTWSRDTAQGMKTKSDSQKVPLSSWNVQHVRTERLVLDACSSNYLELNTDDLLQVLSVVVHRLPDGSTGGTVNSSSALSLYISCRLCSAPFPIVGLRWRVSARPQPNRCSAVTFVIHDVPPSARFHLPNQRQLRYHVKLR